MKVNALYKKFHNSQRRGNAAKTVNELKAGIFAQRAMVDQARQGLCYQRET